MSEVGDGDSCETEQGSLWNLMLYLQVDNVRIELSCLMVWEDPHIHWQLGSEPRIH